MLRKKYPNDFRQLDHPEKHEDEIWITNCFGKEDLDRIYWETKRCGTLAYDCDNQLIPGAYPIFIKKVEWDTRNDDLDFIW